MHAYFELFTVAILKDLLTENTGLVTYSLLAYQNQNLIVCLKRSQEQAEIMEKVTEKRTHKLRSVFG